MNTPLVVIDMQAEFRASSNKLVRNGVIRQIKNAMERRDYIVFVEFDTYGPTLRMLTRLTDNYPLAIKILKYDTDGSYVLKNLFDKKGIRFTSINICGVEASCCVRDTEIVDNAFKGILKKRRSVKIV